MLSYFKLATAALLTFGTLSFSQDVTLTIDGTSLNYESSADIYGWQFGHDGCASGASGGASVDAGFMISCSEFICLGFSLTGSFVSLGSGTLVDLGGECATLSDFVFAGEGGSSLEVELSDGGGDPVLPTVSILSPADGSSFDDVTSVDVEVSCSDCGDGDHYHAYLDGEMQGMFYEDNFSVNVGYGDHALTVNLADGGHQEYDHEGSSASVSFSVLETSAGGCDDPSACNYGDPDNDCTYAEENYDCEGNCTAEVDCAGVCGGDAVVDECGECGGDGIDEGACDCAGNVEDCAGECGGDAVVDECGVCGGDGNCGGDNSIELSFGAIADGTMEIIMNNTMPIAGFQFNVTGTDLDGASGGSAADAGFQVSTGVDGIVLGFSMTGGEIPVGSGVLTNLNYTALADQACLTNEVLALGEWGGGFYEINIGGCAALDFGSAGCTDESACNYDADVDADDGSCYYDEAGCTEGVSGECEAAGGVGGYTFDGCADIATSDDFLASCEALGVGASIELACMGAGGSQEDCAMLAMIYEMAFSGDCTSAIAHAISDDGSALCTLAGAIAEDTYSGCDDLAASGCAETCGDETFTADVLYDSDSDISGFQFNVNGVDLTNVYGGAAAAGNFSISFSPDMVIGFSLTGTTIPAGNGTLVTLEYTGGDSPCLDNLILSDPDANGLDATIEDCLTISYEAPVSGCTDVDACNYDASAMDDDGSCTYAEENYDCEGNCTADIDCADECGGSAVEDCAGVCGGSAVEDECGVCGGDGSSCAPGVYGLALNDDGNLDVTFDSPADIYGFQFDVSAVTVTGASGGAAADAGFTTSTGNNTVLGFSFSGSFIPAGSGVLTVLSFEGSGEACLSNIVVAGAGGSNLDTTSGDCATIDETCESGIYDCAGVCDGDAVEDCLGECGGSAASDDCGVCNGGNADDLGCGCFEAGPSGCDNACGSTLENDECGVCGGDGSSCAPGVYGLALNDDGGLDVTFDSPDDIYGFQFDVSAVTVTGASGGAAADAGFTTSTGNNTVLGFSFSGSFIPAGSGVLTVLSFEGSGEACLSNIVVSGIGGSGLDAASGDCATIEDCESGIYDCAGVCDGTAVEDCAGECGGSAEVDECGVCNGDGIADGACDCAGNVEDCAGECGGSAVVDECGECGGDGIADGECDCAGNVEDCAGECGGDAVVDECGDCGGDGIADGTCDCAGNVEDCNGDCGGTAEVDECGVCGGDGIADGACDCAGSVEDCAGECGGTAENCPDWVDCAPCYENTASMTAIVLDALTGDQMGDAGDILAAFDDAGDVRGIALQLDVPEDFPGDYAGTILYEIQIRGDAAGDAISFKYYDASADEVLDSGTGYTFVIDDIIGNAIMPHEISVGAITLSIDIASGWNWFSLNVEGDMSIGSVMASLTSTDGDFIKSASASSTYYPDFGWYGGLEVLGVTGMYKFNSANADLLVFTGAPVDPASTPIELASGWNWLGFTPQNDGATADALGTITTNDGDFIKNQGASSTYYNDFGWYGGLEVMAPTEGYMLSVAEGSTLTYPNFGADDALTRAKVEKDMPVAVSDWEVDYHDYEFNGHITMSIDSREDSHGDYIAAFVGDECRGLAERMYFPFGDSYMYSVMVYSNKTDGEALTFKYYDSAIGEIVEYAETIDFTSDMIVGDGFNTYSLSSEASDMQQPMTYGISDAYPNPFNPVTSFEYTLEKDGMVQVAIYDISGRMVSELVNGYQSAGSYPVVWDAQELSSGVYMVNMISGDYSTVQKVMLIK